MIGVILLYAMWACTFWCTEMLWISWLGIVVWSATPDYVEGWIYVISVGMAGWGERKPSPMVASAA
jgi:hypothetical protein